jgi:hypothetical protein
MFINEWFVNNLLTINQYKILIYYEINNYFIKLVGSTHLSVCQTCFQCMIFVHKMYEPMNEQISHDFHY